MNITISCPVVESMMHGVAFFSLGKGRRCTAFYTDGNFETAEISQANADAIREYHRYQELNGPAAQAPNAFSIVSDIQSQR